MLKSGAHLTGRDWCCGVTADVSELSFLAASCPGKNPADAMHRVMMAAHAAILLSR
jgi:hypothetical protein